MATFFIGVIAFSDITPPPSVTETVGETGTFTVAGSAVPITLVVDDDDDEFDDGFIDPPGFSTGANNQLLVNAVTINGTTFPAGSQVELEFSVDTTDGDLFHYVRIAGENVGIGGPTLPQAGQTFTTTNPSDAQEMGFDDVVCFTAGTHIETPSGPRLIEELRAGDFVTVLDGPPQPLAWVGQRRLSTADLMTRPYISPIRIEVGALGNAVPLEVSPQHRILVRDTRLEPRFGSDTALVPAKALVNGRTIRQRGPTRPVTYVHILFERHQIVITSGLLSESFYPGAYIMTAMEKAAREEIFAIFPNLRRDPNAYGQPIHHALRPQEAKRALV